MNCTSDTANYRPISVGEPISRLYANIMVQRLVTYTEQQQLRSATQTGYRPELGTIHPAFALQHAVDKQTCQQAFVPVFCGPQISLR